MDENQSRSSKPGVRFSDREESISSHEDEKPSYTYQETKSKLRLKTKTKIKRSKWRTKSAPTLRRMDNVDETEMTSCTEFSQETNISFAAYMKKRTPYFNLKKTKSKSKSNKVQKSERNGNINLLGFTGRDDNLQLASERNVTFNPIFQEEDSEKRKEKEMFILSRDEHVHNQNTTRDDHVEDQPTICDISSKKSLQSRDDQKSRVVQPRTVHVRMNDYTESNRYDSHVGSTCSENNLKSNKMGNGLDDHVPVTCIDGPYADEYSDCEDRVTVSSIDSFHSFEEQNSDHVPVTCIDDVGEQNDDEDSHVRRPTLIRAGRIHDLDMCGWYDDESGIDYNKLFYDDDYTDDNDDDDFTTRMLKRTAAILTFDMTTRRRELYTIDEEPEEE